MNSIPLIEHIIELKWRFFYITYHIIFNILLCYIFSEQLFFFLINPLNNHNFIFTNLTEMLITYLKISCLCGFLLSFPYILYQILSFILPGLYKNEAVKFIIFLIIYCFMNICLLSLIFWQILPILFEFLTNFEIQSQDININMTLKVNEYINILFKIFFIYLFLINIPILLILAILKIPNTKIVLYKSRKYIYLMCIIFIISISPPDLLSQLLFFIPLCLCLEFSFILIFILNRYNYIIK